MFTFSHVTLPATQDWQVALRGGTKFCLIGDVSDNTVYSSTTGRASTWASDGFIGAGDWHGGVGLGSTLIVVGVDKVTVSLDEGGTWTAGAIPSGNWWSVAFDGMRAVTVSQGGAGTAMYSDDFGFTWSPCTILTADWREVVYDGLVYIAVSFAGDVYTSTDGIIFTVASAPAFWWNCATVKPDTGTILIGGYDPGTNLAVAIYSVDHGSTWYSSAGPGDFPGWVEALAACNAGFLAVFDGHTKYAFSADGISWDLELLPDGGSRSLLTAAGSADAVLAPEFNSTYLLFGEEPPVVAAGGSPFFMFSFP